MTKNQKLKLSVKTVEDMNVMSTLCQDAVGMKRNMRWHQKDKMFSMTFNRFMWEDFQQGIEDRNHQYRIQSIMIFRWILSVKRRGFQVGSNSEYFSLLSISYKQNKGANRVSLIFSGDSEICLEVEYLEAFLNDIGDSYPAVIEKLPRHEI